MFVQEYIDTYSPFKEMFISDQKMILNSNVGTKATDVDDTYYGMINSSEIVTPFLVDMDHLANKSNVKWYV